jgi:hypothetical protein
MLQCGHHYQHDEDDHTFSNILLIHGFSSTIFFIAIRLYIANTTKSAKDPHIIIVILVNVYLVGEVTK